MQDIPFTIERFHPKEASGNLWEEYFEFDEKLFAEFNPNEPFPSRSQEKSFIKNPHPHYTIYRWLIFEDANPRKLIGNGLLWTQNEQSPEYENIKEKINFRVNVLKEYRRKGIGTKMLKTLIKKAIDLQKNIMRAEVRTDSAVAFCNHYQGEIVAKRGTNRLYIENIDWNLMEEWRVEGKRKASGVTLETFESVPEKMIEEYCKLYTTVSNDAPAEDFSGEMVVTPEKRRIDEKLYSDNNLLWFTLVSQEKDGILSGLTEIFHNKEYPIEIEQELTGVLAPYRGRGLGKWLKAEMIFYIRENFPEAKFIQTGNNDRNVPIMKINERMGFKRHKNETFYEFNTQKLAKLLETI